MLSFGVTFASMSFISLKMVGFVPILLLFWISFSLVDLFWMKRGPLKGRFVKGYM